MSTIKQANFLFLIFLLINIFNNIRSIIFNDTKPTSSEFRVSSQFNITRASIPEFTAIQSTSSRGHLSKEMSSFLKAKIAASNASQRKSTGNNQAGTSKSKTPGNKDQGSKPSTSNGTAKALSESATVAPTLVQRRSEATAAASTLHAIISVNSKASPLPDTNEYVVTGTGTKRHRMNSPLVSPSASISISPTVIASAGPSSSEVEEIDVDAIDSDNESSISSMNNESTSEEDAAPLAETPFIEVQPKTKPKKLPAIKLRISDPLKSSFNNPLAIFNEIKRCFPDASLKIKFAEIAKFDAAILIIASDDEATHTLLNDANNWRLDAFGRGIRMKNQAPSTRSGGAQVTYSFSIKNIPLGVDVGSDSVIDHFKGLGFSKIVRSLKRETNEPTSYLKLYTESKEVYNKHMYKGEPVYFLYQRCYAIPETRPLQCRNCQGTGHIAFNCPQNEPTCCRCGDAHRLRDCDKFDIVENVKIYNKTFCINCKSEDHIACSRKCQVLQDHVKEKEAAKAQKLAHKQPHKQQLQPQQQQKSKAAPSTQQKPTYSSMAAKHTEKNTPNSATHHENNNNNSKNKQSTLEAEFKEIKAFLIVLLEVLKGSLPENLLAQCPATIMNIIAPQPTTQ